MPGFSKSTNMKTTKITIPDNLTPEQEAFAIGKQLAKKALSGGGQNKEVKRIGDEINIIDLSSQIIVTRASTEKPITMITCNVCNCEYQSDRVVYYYHNYGGHRTRRGVCSDDCRQFMIDNFGARIAKSASKLPAAVNYFTKIT